MSESPYQIRGGSIPQMLGRELLFDRLSRHLTKPTPDHMCVIGPTGFGKSVLLHHLADHFNNREDLYAASMYLDLRHGTPMTDHEFRILFAGCIKSALQPVESELADCLELDDNGLSYLLNFVFEEMHRKGSRLLAVLDGFDHVLKGSGITRNLWDELLSLCRMSSLRLVTGSRGRLRELCKTEESRTSDFWEIFYDTPLQVGCFEAHDWSGFLSPFSARNIKLDGSAQKEFANWTGGVPTLAVALASRLLQDAPAGILLSKPHVDSVAKTLLGDRRDLLADLWDDCSIDLQSLLADVANDELSIADVPYQVRRNLELRGFARPSGNKLRSSCCLMAHYASEQAGEVNDLQRLFGNTKRFEGNIRRLLELRLAQVKVADSQLCGYVERGIRDLKPDPANSIVWARSIAERALDLIWAAELPSDRTLPHEWDAAGIEFDERGKLPRRRGHQCGILRRITETEERGPVSKFITKPTCLLVDHIQSVGNFGQHKDGNTVSISIAAAFCLSAIALCESLSRDLATPRGTATDEDEEPNTGP